MSGGSGSTLLSLKNDGDKAVLALCGAPHLRDVFYSDETKTYEPWDEARANGAKKKTRHAMSVYVVTLNGAQTNRMLVFEIPQTVMMEFIALRDKHGVGTCLFGITRHGTAGDKDTTYEIQPDQPITPDLCAVFGRPDPNDRDGWISGTTPLAEVEKVLAGISRKRSRKQAPQGAAESPATGAVMTSNGSGSPVNQDDGSTDPTPEMPSPGAETAETSAKADSEDSGSDAAKPHGLLDVITRTVHARYAAAAPEDAVALLAACSAPMPPSICWTQYEGGTYDTVDGRPCVGGLEELAQALTEYAQLVVSKGKGRWFMGARSKNGGCRDADIDSITLITLDCDNRGEWGALRGVFDQAGIGYIAQRSSSHSPPTAIKWHLSIALARPWTGEKPTWRAIWRFLVGIFAAVGGLTVDFDFVDDKGVRRPNYGFDHATDRLGQPIFAAAKRTKEQSPPETIYLPGKALDLDKLLADGGFGPSWLEAAKQTEAKRQAARATASARVASGVHMDPSSSLLALAFSEAGMLGERIERASASGYAVECPLEVHHSPGGHRFDTSTMIMDAYEPGGPGWFNCKHSCGDMDPEKVLNLLPRDAVERARKKWKEAKKKAAKARATNRPASTRPAGTLQTRNADGTLLRVPDGRPRVVAGEDIHRVIADLDEALALTDPRLFQRGSELVIVRGVTAEDAKRLGIKFAPDGILIAPLHSPTLIARVTEFVDYGYWKKEEDGSIVWRECLPSRVLSPFLSKPFWAHVRPIRGITVTPIMHLDDGSIVAEGFDAKTQYLVASNIALPAIADRPAKADAEAALRELLEPFEQFPYETEAERYVPVVIALTLLLRAVIEGNVPAILNSAPQKNCGKSLAAKAATMLATGRVPASNTWPKLEEEQEKMIGAAAEAGAEVLFFDNVAEGAVIGGAPLDKVLTCDGFNGFRILGRSELKRLPWNAIVIFTANRARIGGDSDRRVVQATMIRREETIEYRHPELITYIMAERGRLLAAAFTLIRAWIQAGSPRAGVQRLDSFERWAQTVASMIKWAGGPDVRTLVRDDVGTDRDELEGAFLEKLYVYLNIKGKKDVTVNDLVADVFALPAPPDFNVLRELMEQIGGFVGKGAERRFDKQHLGNRIGKMKDVLQGGYRLRLAGKTDGRSRWTVERSKAKGVEGGQGGRSQSDACEKDKDFWESIPD
jgi:hypothetical protein